MFGSKEPKPAMSMIGSPFVEVTFKMPATTEFTAVPEPPYGCVTQSCVNGPQADGPYQVATAPVPKDPPVAESVVEPPVQIVVVPETPVGGVERVLTVTVMDAQLVVLQLPAYLTK